MKAKLTFLAGLAAGYVLGTRAGRGSYEKIKASAKSIWDKDAVQETVTTVQHAIKDQAGEAAHKLVQQAKHTHKPTPDASTPAGTGSGHQEAESGLPGGKPLDTTSKVSDEFPDAALTGGEGQNWSDEDGLGSRH